jgi:hypothetical protein
LSDMEQSDVVAAEADAPVAEPVASAPDPVPVIARQPSSDSPTQAPEAAADTDEAPPSIEDAARTLIGFLRSHRTVGDSDVDAAVTAVEAALAQNA